MGSHGAGMMGGGGSGVYEYAEIWPGFQVNANAMPYGLSPDPMFTDHGSNHGPVNHGSRKRKGEDDESTKGGASTSYSNGGAGGRNNGGKNSVCDGGDGKRANENNIENEKKSGKNAMQPSKPAEQPKQDYIHVRARRGQATDSHSLAERARREKISERMKILQDLVPGCNKVIGKALVLDEIINYIQSLQCQVEFLSMKIEAVNERGAMDGYSSKEQPFETPGIAFGSQSAREYNSGSSPDWLHMQTGGSFERMS